MKKNRGKQVQTQTQFMELCSPVGSGCEKHPTFLSPGVCAFCLRDRLMSLVCEECGEQRLSFCSCSSYSYSSPIPDVGSVGRVSFLIENDTEAIEKDRSFVLKRSRSSGGGFWRLSALFRKRKGGEQSQSINTGIWAAVSRSRSLCSFRGGDFGGATSEDGRSMSVSGARSSSVTCAYSEPDRDHHRRSGHEILSSFSSRSGKRVSGMRIKESNFDDASSSSGFIDLNLGLVGREEFRIGSFRDQNGGVSSGGRRRGFRVWRWIFGSRGQRQNMI